MKKPARVLRRRNGRVEEVNTYHNFLYPKSVSIGDKYHLSFYDEDGTTKGAAYIRSQVVRKVPK